MSTQKDIEAQVAQYQLNQTLSAIKSYDKKVKDQLKAKVNSLTMQLNALKKDRADVVTAMSEPEFQKAFLEKQAVQAAIDYGTPGHPNYTSSQYLTLVSDINFQQKLIDGYKTRLKDIDTKKIATQKQIDNLNHPPKPFFPNAGTGVVSTKGNSNTIVHTSTPDPSVIHFNAPMVSQAYFRGIQSEMLHGNYVNAGPYTDAKNTWSIGTNGTPITGRGAFQVDKQTVTAASVAQATKDALRYGNKIDTNLYGFKFLYNPGSVSMNWGAVQKTDPTYESMGVDPFVPGTQNLIQSYLEFSIIINRIEDFNYLDQNGLKSLNLSQTQLQATDRSLATNPYPKNVPNSELIQIFEKGTMYDIEYLFKTMHALTGNTGYKSLLMNSVTSDPGWLPVRPVELHLGNKLRYRVRIQNLTVNHSVFNPRMVPILSTVTFTCARYWDAVDFTQTVTKK